MDRMRINNKTVRIGGEMLDPKTIYIGDSNTKVAATNPTEFSRPGETMVSIPGGTMKDVRDFLNEPGIRCTLRTATAFVLFGIGTNDLCRRGGITPEGDPEQLPGINGHQLTGLYEDLVGLIHEGWPRATIVSFDPIPRKTDGFGNSWVSQCSNLIEKMTPKHVHVSYAERYFLKQMAGRGRRDLRADCYESDGVHLRICELAKMFDAAHEALAIQGRYHSLEGRPLTPHKGFKAKF
jgi:hypothetical protein